MSNELSYNKWLYEEELRRIKNRGAKTSSNYNVMRVKRWRLLRKLELEIYSKERVLAHYSIDKMLQEHWDTIIEDILDRVTE